MILNGKAILYNDHSMAKFNYRFQSKRKYTSRRINGYLLSVPADISLTIINRRKK